MGVFTSLITNWQLIRQITTREIQGRYKGSILGLFWSFINPLIMLAVYTFVFSVIFNARWSTDSSSKTEFALALFVGLMTHGILAECLNRAPTIVINNVNYVKKVVFPLNIFPWVTMGTALFHFLASLLVWSLLYILVNHSYHWTAVFLPVIFFPLILFTLGASWFLASLGVYLRDLGQLISIITTMLLFLAPVFYPISALPEKYHIFIYANPLTLIIEQTRDILIWGELPNFKALSISTFVSLIIASLGFNWFEKTKRGFADVL